MSVQAVEGVVIDAKREFLLFLKTFRDRQGVLKYRERIKEMVSLKKTSVTVDLNDLYMYNPKLVSLLVRNPEPVLEAASEALREIVRQEDPVFADAVDRFFVRVKHMQTVKLRDLRSEYVGRLVMVEGILVRATPVKEKLIKSVLRHVGEEGEHEFTWPLEGEMHDEFELPAECPVCGGRPPFRLVPEKSVYADWQKVVIQEKPEEVPPGQLPRSIEVILTRDLVDLARPGDRVSVTGVLKVRPVGSLKRGTGKPPIFDMYIDAVHIDVSQKLLEEVMITKEDEEKIKNLAKDPWIRKRIIASIAPGIHGHWDIKEAIALALFGGVPKQLEDGTRIRGDIHVLIIGDPGTAKSQLLQFAARVAPRGIYTSGKGSSAAGLTAAVLRDKTTGEYYLEAGALVLADGGLAAIDEIDKMRSEDRSAIHEALEQQSYHKDFEILLADGRKVRIGELVDELIEKNRDRVILGRDTEVLPVRGLRVMAYDLRRKKIVPVEAVSVSRHKAPRRFVRITFSNGRTIVVTPEHPIVVWKDGRFGIVRADMLQAGTIVPGVREYLLERGSGIFSKLAKEFGVDDLEILARFIGFLLSDGFVYSNPDNGYYEIGFSNTNTKIIEEFKETLRLMRLKYSEQVQKTSTRRKKPLYTVRIISKKLYNNIAKYFPEIMLKDPKGEERPSRHRRIPALIFEMPEKARKAFLNAFFKGDGFVDNYRVGFATSSSRLAEDLQDLLLTLGIYSYIFKETDESGRTYYKVIISGTDDMKKLAEIIADDERYPRVVRLIDASSRRRNYRDVMPYELASKLRTLLNGLDINDGQVSTHVAKGYGMHRERIRAYLEEAKLRLRRLEDAVRRRDVNTVRRLVRISELSRELGTPYSTLKYRLLVKQDPGLASLVLSKAKRRISMLKQLASELEQYVNGNIRFLRVKSVEIVENTDSEWVYDITVEPYNLFVSHGVVLHNSVSIAKAGIVARLNARTTVIAAGNPKYGRWLGTNIAENIELPPTILSRFDLIFILRDEPHPDLDRKLARHVLRVHREAEYMRPEIPVELLKKYVSYARRNVHPRMTERAAEIIEKFFVELRKQGLVEGRGGRMVVVPITARQLEALVRLAEAHARMALKPEVTEEDALEAIRLMMVMMQGVGYDTETGMIDSDIISVGMPRSRQEKLYRLSELIRTMVEESGEDCVKLADLKERAETLGIKADELQRLLKMLRGKGEIYERRFECYAPV